MTCYFCNRPMDATADMINRHHFDKLRSEGGTETAPAHEQCHVEYHSRNGHFREWGRRGGRISAVDKHWAFHLKGVKDDPLYDQARQFNRMYYA